MLGGILGCNPSADSSAIHTSDQNVGLGQDPPPFEGKGRSAVSPRLSSKRKDAEKEQMTERPRDSTGSLVT